MKDRALEILDLASSHPPSRWLSLADIVEMIRSGCPGPRTAEAYARELIWELTQAKLLERSARKDRWRITGEGRGLVATRWLAEVQS